MTEPRSVQRSLALAAAVGLLAACPGASTPRPYPAPGVAEVLAHVRGLAERARTLRAETKSDFRLGKDRANLTVFILAAWGGKLRLQAMSPAGNLAADLASDGKGYCFVDVNGGCAECGPAGPYAVQRFTRITLPPDDVVAVMLGGTPILDGADDASAKVTWDPATAREIVELEEAGPTGRRQRIELDGRDHHWDVLVSELRDAEGRVLVRVRHKDFRAVAGVRLPAASLLEQEAETVRILWRDQEVNVPLEDERFRFTPEAGLPACGEAAGQR